MVERKRIYQNVSVAGEICGGVASLGEERLFFCCLISERENKVFDFVRTEKSEFFLLV